MFRGVVKAFFARMDEIVYQVERVLIVLALVVMCVVVFLQVVLRFFDQGFPWAEELARYLMIWAGFLGASIATRHRRHLKIDILPRFLETNSAARSVVLRLAALVSAGFCFFLVKVGYDFVANSLKFGRTSTSMGVPIWIIQLSIPLTTLIMACRFTGHVFGDLREEADIDRLLEKEPEA
jgi:C4-dicarboxylate transporter, DctQ subunit